MRLLSSLSGVGSSGVLKLQIPPLAALGRNDSAVAYSRICLCFATTHILLRLGFYYIWSLRAHI